MHWEAVTGVRQAEQPLILPLFFIWNILITLLYL